MSSIFDISAEYMDLMDALEAKGGEITEELEAVLISNQEDFDKKARSYIGIIKQKESDLLLVKDEIARLNAKKKRVTATTDRLKRVLLDALELYGVADKNGIKRYKTGTFDLGTRKSTSYPIHGEDELKKAMVDNIIQTVDNADVDKEIESINNGSLLINYNPPTDEIDDVEFDAIEKVDGDQAWSKCTDPEAIALNAVEVDFLNSNLTYGIKLDISYTDMLKIARAINEFIPNDHIDVEYDVVIPKKEASEVVKTHKGFRIACVEEKKSLTIK